MPMVLKASKPERCIGCGLCVIKASLDSQGSISLASSPVRVSGVPGKFNIVIDYGADINAEKIKKICPRGCFDIEPASES